MSYRTRIPSTPPSPHVAARPDQGSSREAVAVGAAGGVLGGLVGSVVGLGPVGAAVGAANGAVSGKRGIYDWSSVKGFGAFVLDSTWSLGNTASSLVAHAAGAVRGRPEFDRRLSVRQNRHVYGRGFQPRKGFAITLGNVINGAGDTGRARRAKLVTDHEDVHVWQSRWFGPAFPVLYVGWMVGGGAIGAAMWATTRRDEPFGKVVETCAYYLNPFEYWAYSRDDFWPPTAMLEGIGYKRPAVRSFASFR